MDRRQSTEEQQGQLTVIPMAELEGMPASTFSTNTYGAGSVSI